MSKMFTADTETPICALQVAKHVSTLSDRQLKYAYHMSQAAWHGHRIVLAQVSVESPAIFDFITTQFAAVDKNMSADDLLKIDPTGDKRSFLAYAAQFLGNCGNYQSFGDTKFVPGLSQQALDALVEKSGNVKGQHLYAKCRDAMYALEPESVRMLGYPGKQACSAYYSQNISESEIALVQAFLEARNVNAYNTRLFKDDVSGEFTVKLASSEILPTETCKREGETIHIAYGDYAESMAKIVKSIEAAIEFSENDVQRQMLEKYALSFKTGSIDAHKDSQR